MDFRSALGADTAMTLPAPNPVPFLLNGEELSADQAPGRLLLDFLRIDQRRVGTKEGCREGDCGACTVLLGEENEAGGMTYRAVPSCMLLLGHARGRHVVTIEGLRVGNSLSPIQQAVVEHGASQCGFCTPGFIVSFTGFLLNATEFSVQEATNAISGNLCRCTGYVSLVRAARAIVERFAGLEQPGPVRIAALVEAGVLPAFFADSIPTGSAETASNAGAQLMGGGTDLIVQRGAELDSLSPCFALPLQQERTPVLEGEDLLLPAGATFEDLRRSQAFTDLWPTSIPALDRFASPLIRERASVAGNIANASPIADGTAIFLGLDAILELSSSESRRSLPLSDFFLGYKRMDLGARERIEQVRIPAAPAGRQFNFEKISKRESLDIATVNSAMGLCECDGIIESVSISAGGVAPIPLLLRETAAHLIGRPINAQTILAALPVLNTEIAPIDDVRGSASYKRLALRQIFFAHFLALFPDRVDEGSLLEATL